MPDGWVPEVPDGWAVDEVPDNTEWAEWQVLWTARVELSENFHGNRQNHHHNIRSALHGMMLPRNTR